MTARDPSVQSITSPGEVIFSGEGAVMTQRGQACRALPDLGGEQPPQSAIAGGAEHDGVGRSLERGRHDPLWGATWLFVVNRRRPGILADIEADLERAPELIAEEGVEIDELAPQPAMA